MPATLPRLVFAGTPAFAAQSLRALIAHCPAQVVGVLTQPDRPAGRGRHLQPSPVKELALAHGLPVQQPRTLRDPESQQALAALEPELMIVVAYGLILPRVVVELPRHGCINVHASLLPRWRGAAPIERAIEAGDAATGITIMQMDEGLDTGAVLHARSCEIRADDTGGSLRERLATLGAEALVQALHLLVDGGLRPEPQDERHASYAPKLRREEALIDWGQPAALIERRVRAFNPANSCHTIAGGESLRVLRAQLEHAHATNAAPGTVLGADRAGIVVACGDGALRLLDLQLAGGRPLAAAALLNGRPALFQPGARLG